MARQLRALSLRQVKGLDALLLVVSQPSVEETTRAQFGCYSFYYPELPLQLLRARLSPFNNRWTEPYNFTPAAGGVELLPVGTPYTALLKPLSAACPERLAPSEEPSVTALCPVPATHGALAAAAAGAERGFLLVMPRCAPHALRWLRALLDGKEGADTGGAGCGGCVKLLRAKEYSGAKPDFCGRLLSDMPTGQRQARLALAAEASRGRLVGLELSGAGCSSALAQHVAAWNAETRSGSGSAAAAYAASSPAEAQHMAGVFFEDVDLGTEHS